MLLYYISAVPSQAPSGLTVAASTSTSITASWQLPPEYARHGIITGFKLFYKEKDSAGLPTELTNNVTTLTRVISTLDKYTEYEFQVLAFTFQGDGPKSSVVVERTEEDGENLLSDILIILTPYLGLYSRINQDLLVTASMHKSFKDVSVFVPLHAEYVYLW